MEKREKKRKSMESVVRTYHSSSHKKKDFASQSGIHISKLNYWIKKVEEEEQPGRFIAVDIPLTKTESTELEICYPNGIRIKAVNSSASFINQLIKAY